MSWGFFVSLELEMPEEAWNELSWKAPKEFEFPADWPDKTSFAQGFRSDYWTGHTESFGKVLFAKSVWKNSESKREARVENQQATIRFLMLLDKSQLDIASAPASLFYAARSSSAARGRLVVVNDGTGPEEDGWEFVLSKGAVKRKKIKDIWEFSDRFGAELYSDLHGDVED